MNFNLYHQDHPDIEGSRSRAEAMLGADGMSDRRIRSSQLRLIRDCLAVCEAETPMHYDADTEVKTGGVGGIAVQLRSGEFLLAVNMESRRQGIGTRLLRTLNDMEFAPGFFDFSVHNANAQMFALSQGFRPHIITTAGRIHYTMNGNVLEAE